MSLEQSIDRLSNLIEVLIAKLESPPAAVSKQAKTEPDTAKKEVVKDEGKSSSGATKESANSTAPSDSGKSTGESELVYTRDVAPHFSRLVAANREEAIKLMRQFKPDAKKLEEAMLVDGVHDQHRMRVTLEAINALLGE